MNDISLNNPQVTPLGTNDTASVQPPAEKPPAEKPPSFSLKDGITLSISLLALLVSALNAFWTVVRVEERFSVVVRGPQLAYRIKKETLSPEAGDSELAFINSGNRPVVVLAVYVYFNTVRDANGCGQQNLSQRFVTTFKPIVVKEGEIATTTIKVDSIESLNNPIPLGKAKPSDRLFDLDKTNLNEKTVKAVSCLVVQLSTPTAAFHESIVPISRFSMIDNKAFLESLQDEKPGQPALLFASFGNIFGNWLRQGGDPADKPSPL